MYKKVYKVMSAIALVALTFGSFAKVSASSATVPQAAATTYYVSTTGKDTNTGTSAAPFKTIQKCANVAGAGSTCSVAAGTYSERVNVTRSGIIFQANGKVTIQGFVISTSNTKVIGFYSLNSSNNSGAFYVNGSGNTIRNNIAEGPCMAGIVLSGNSNLAEGNEVFKSRQCGGSGPDADGMRVFGDGNVIRGNYVHDISKASNPTAHIDCIQNWGTLLNTTIEGNTCSVVDAGIQTDVGNVHNITIRNNVFIAARPLNMRGEGLKITNNVFVGNATSSFVSLQSSSNVTFQNNIVYNTSDGFITSVGTVKTGGYNIFYNSSGKAPRRDSGYSYVSGKLKWPTDKWQVNPLFVNPTAGDYRLKAGSPAIDTGLGGVDIGAFASGAVGAAPTTAPVQAQASLETYYDDNHSSLVYSPNWPSFAHPYAYGGLYRQTSQNGAFITFPFTGQSFSIIYQSAAVYGKMNVYVDGLLVGTISQNDTKTTFKKRWDYPGQLTLSSHILKLEFVAQGSLQMKGSLDAVIVRSTASSTAVQSLPATVTASATTVAVQPSLTPAASAVPVLPTSTVVTQPSATPIPATVTAVPVQPTATSVPPTAVQPTVAQPTATAQQQPTQQASETIYDDKSFAYSADWKNVVAAQASGGSFRKTTEDGSYVTFTFTGQSFSLLYTVGPKFGKADVYIDGVFAGTINQNGKTNIYKKRWDYPKQLAPGTHTLKLVVDSPNGSIDAVIVR